MKNKEEIKFKRKAMRIISERVCELLDKLKDDFINNLEDIGGNLEKQIEVIRELEVVKYRIWRYK